MKKWTSPLNWILQIQINQSTKFQLKLTILMFKTKLPKKGISSLKQIKWTSPLISPYFNEQLIFGLHLPKKSLSVKNGKSEHHHWIEFCKFKLIKVPNLSLNWQFWCLGLWLKNCLKRILSVFQTKLTSPLNSAYIAF